MNSQPVIWNIFEKFVMFEWDKTQQNSRSLKKEEILYRVCLLVLFLVVFLSATIVIETMEKKDFKNIQRDTKWNSERMKREKWKGVCDCDTI